MHPWETNAMLHTKTIPTEISQNKYYPAGNNNHGHKPIYMTFWVFKLSPEIEKLEIYQRYSIKSWENPTVSAQKRQKSKFFQPLPWQFFK